MPDALLSRLLIKNSTVEDAQRIALLISVSPDDDDLEGEELPDPIGYEKVASIIRSSDNQFIRNPSGSNGIMQGFSVKPKMTREEQTELKKKTKSGVCGKLGHWHKDPECPKNKDKNELQLSF